MAKTKAGQVVTEKWSGIKGQLLGVGILNAIGDRQGDFIRLQNISQMVNGRNRNGGTLGKYKTTTANHRERLGLQTSKVDLRRTGKFHDSIRVSGQKSKISADNSSATIEIEISVPKEMEGRLEGFRSGKYGKKGSAIKRPVVGMADVGTPLRTQQERQLKRIAMEEAAKALRGGGVEFSTKDSGGSYS